jgi:hypothetical protein
MDNHQIIRQHALVWNTAKGECARLFSNKTSFQDQRMHLEEAFSNKIDSKYCSEAFRHVRQFEEKYWEADLALDDELDDGTELYGINFGIFRQNAKVVDSLLSSTLRIAGMRRNERARERAPQCRRPFSNEDAA